MGVAGVRVGGRAGGSIPQKVLAAWCVAQTAAWGPLWPRDRMIEVACTSALLELGVRDSRLPRHQPRHSITLMGLLMSCLLALRIKASVGFAGTAAVRVSRYTMKAVIQGLGVVAASHPLDRVSWAGTSLRRLLWQMPSLKANRSSSRVPG